MYGTPHKPALADLPTRGTSKTQASIAAAARHLAEGYAELDELDSSANRRRLSPGDLIVWRGLMSDMARVVREFERLGAAILATEEK